MALVRRKERTVQVSAELQSKWSAFRDALDAVASEHTKSAQLSFPAFYAHDIPDAEEEIERALRASHALTVRAQYVQDADRRLAIELSWFE